MGQPSDLPGRDTTRPPNRLHRETSPYLLQHAHNPVDWYPWGAEAIDRARREGKLLFVSIGYATCYWCHVMERESFESDSTARVLNERFVAVKVDREQRPDIDDVYMTACQAYTQWTEGRASGGWPLSVFVEPDTLKPVFVGTYYPPVATYGRPAFTELLAAVDDVWTRRRTDALAQAERIAAAVASDLNRWAQPVVLDRALAERAARALLSFHDRENGGFGGAPKFPQPAYLELLMATVWDEPEIDACVQRTLDRMACGGIFDQIGGGFHRYSVDSVWGVPHFEKMLYDNALLATLYARSAKRRSDAFHAEIARRTCDYVLREMTDIDGTFFSAQDAESEAREGKSYVWQPEEVRLALTEGGREDLVPFALATYGLDGPANFHDPHHADAARGDAGSYVLRLAGRPNQLAASLGVGFERWGFERWTRNREAMDAALLAARRARVQPITDDKVLTSWNGLLIAALAEVGELLREPRYVEAARRSADAIDRRMRGSDGTLLRAGRGATASIPAFLEDYAFLIRARLALGRADLERTAEHVARAEKLFREAVLLFQSPRGGFFDGRAGANELFVRGRGLTDGAVPSGNGVMLLNTLDLLKATGAEAYRLQIAHDLVGLSGLIAEQPIAAALATVAVFRGASEAPDVLPRAHTDDDVVSVTVHRLGSDEFDLTLRLAPGFHVEVLRKGDDGEGDHDFGGVAVALVGEGALSVSFPSMSDIEKGTADREGASQRVTAVRLRCRVNPCPAHHVTQPAGDETSEAAALVVRVQPCDDHACRPPRRFLVPLPA
jgi:uncharacterized protein YyaL (SSP411 family)